MTETRSFSSDLLLEPEYDESHTEKWEQSLEITYKLSELINSLQASQSPEKVLPVISRFLEKNKSSIAYACTDTALLAELLPSFATLTTSLQTQNIAFETVQKIEEVLTSNVAFLISFDSVARPDLLPNLITVLNYLYGYLNSEISSTVTQKLEFLFVDNPELLPSLVLYAPIFVQPMLEGERGHETQQKILKALSSLREQADKKTALNTLNHYMKILSPSARRELIKQVYVTPLSSEILNAEVLTSTWEKGALGLSHEVNNLEKNVAIITQLKQEYGLEAVEKLHSTYGICHFGRYPIEVFKRFLNKDPKCPTVTVIYPYADYSGAFYKNKNTFTELLGASQKLNFNIVEAGSGRDAYLRVKKLKSENPEEAFDIVLIGGHGQPDSISLGSEGMGAENTITKQMLSPAMLRLINQLLDKNTTLIFNTCNVGTDIDEGSLAKHVFEGTKCKKVIAATKPMGGLRDFKIIKHKSRTQALEVDTDFVTLLGQGTGKKVYSR